jgi:hypothetical protein
MGPRTNPANANQGMESLEDVIKVLKQLSTQFATFTTKMGTVDTMSKQITAMDTKLASMETKLSSALTANKELKAEISEKKKIIEDLRAGYTYLESRCNDLEQYNRSWSVRVFNIPLSEEEERDPIVTRDKTYNLAFLPILQGAMDSGEIAYIPPAEELLEVAHVLPGKAGKAKPVITRFFNRYLRTLCLRKKKEFATKSSRVSGRVGAAAENGPSQSGAARPSASEGGRYSFPFYEDLTKIAFTKMRAISSHSNVQACWSVNGQLRFKLADSDTVRKVISVFDSVETIVG